MSTGEKTSPAFEGSVEGRSTFRFLIVSAAAFCIDAVLALAIHHFFRHVPWWLAAGIAYAVVSAAFYFVHEHWTFQRAGSRNSAWRIAQTVATSLISMGGRIGVIYLLEAWREPGMVGATAYIWLGAMVSLLINYTLSRFWVFSSK
jgi:putative flippase GtrA